MLRTITGSKGSKCRLYLKVFEITELPPPTPPKAYVTISRGKHDDKTTETFITGTCVAVWEQEMMLPVTMYTNSSGGYDEKEVKIAVKDSANGKSIAKTVVNVSDYIKPGVATQAKFLLETKSKGFMGSKTSQCPLRMSIRLEVIEPAAATDSPAVSTVDHTEDVSELSFTDLGDESDDDDSGVSPRFAAQVTLTRAHSRSQSTANPFAGEGGAHTPPALKAVPAPGKKKHRRANSVSLNGNGFSGGIPTKRVDPDRNQSSPIVSVSMNPFDDRSPMGAPAPRERETAASHACSSRMESSQGGSHGCEDVEDYVAKLANYQVQLEFATNDARETRRALDIQKKHYTAMLDKARRDNITQESTEGKNSDDSHINFLEKQAEEQDQMIEGLQMQVVVLKANLDLMPHASSGGGLTGGGSESRDEQLEKLNERISWLETELVMAKMKLAEACAAGFIDSSH